MKQSRDSISSILRKAVRKRKNQSTLTYADLVNALEEHALGLITILFALPSALPISIIPGFSFIFGLPIVFIALHLIIGKEVLWLPASLAQKNVNIDKLRKVVNKCLPALMFIERLLKPRLLFFSSPLMKRFLGLVLLGLSLLLLLPIPFSNFFFASLIVAFGLGMSEKDGLLILITYIATFIYAFVLTRLGVGVWHMMTT